MLEGVVLGRGRMDPGDAGGFWWRMVATSARREISNIGAVVG